MPPLQAILDAVPELTDEQAQTILDALYPRLVDAQVVASTYGLSRCWVYDNAVKLRARVIGSGPKAHKRFVLAEVREVLDSLMQDNTLSATDGEAVTVEPSRRAPRSKPREAGYTPSGAPLLTYKDA